MEFLPHTFLRAMEAEGRHGHDVGGWPITVSRLFCGEGLLQEHAQAFHVPAPFGQPMPKAPQVDGVQLRANQSFAYKRIRSASDLAIHLGRYEGRRTGSIGFYLTDKWADPSIDGVLPAPTDDDVLLNVTHAEALQLPPSGGNKFEFFSNLNGWGDAAGRGEMPFSYFDAYAFERWSDILSFVEIRNFRIRPVGKRFGFQWVGIDDTGNKLYGFELVQGSTQWDMIRGGWTYLSERSGVLEIEELYVRPQYRGRGFGRWLTDQIAKLAAVKGVPLAAWVPFADSLRESPATAGGMVKLLRRLGLSFVPCPEIWAAYKATGDESGSDRPIEPAFFPPRPRSPLKDIVTAAAVSATVVTAGPPTVSVGTTNNLGRLAAKMKALPPSPATEASRALRNDRRLELITKKHNGGLSDFESQELAALHAVAVAETKSRSSVSTFTDAERAVIENALRGESLSAQ